MRGARWMFLAAAVTTVGACGGNQATERSYTVEDTAIADVPLAMREGVFEARAEMSRAAQDLQSGKEALARAEHALTVSRIGVREAALLVEKQEADFKLASRSGDPKAVRSAMGALARARDAVEAARAREDWAASTLELAQAQIRAARAHQDVAAARYEQEKAKVLAETGETPAGFSAAQYDRQATLAQLEYDNARVALERAQRTAALHRSHYERLRGDVTDVGEQAPDLVPGPSAR